MPIHRHEGSSETCICIRGHFEEYFYDAEGRLTEHDMVNWMKANRKLVNAGKGPFVEHEEEGVLEMQA